LGGVSFQRCAILKLSDEENYVACGVYPRSLICHLIRHSSTPLRMSQAWARMRRMKFSPHCRIRPPRGDVSGDIRRERFWRLTGIRTLAIGGCPRVPCPTVPLWTRGARTRSSLSPVTQLTNSSQAARVSGRLSFVAVTVREKSCPVVFVRNGLSLYLRWRPAWPRLV
jgi:hypothetical protein